MRKRLALLALLALFVLAGLFVFAAGASTVGHSKLALPCGASVDADWYRPAGAPTGLVWVQHGYGSSKADVAAYAQELAGRTGALVVAPTLSSDASTACFMGSAATENAVGSLLAGDRAALIASARAAGYTGTVPRPFVMVGHSFGGNFALTVGAAAPADLRAVIVLDGGSLDPTNAQAVAALAALADKPVLTVASPPGTACKLNDLTPFIVASRPGQFVGVQLVGGNHLDTIGWSSLAGILACGLPNLANVAAVQTISSQWVTNALTGSTGGITAGTPGQRIAVGAATAVVLPT